MILRPNIPPLQVDVALGASQLLGPHPPVRFQPRYQPNWCPQFGGPGLFPALFFYAYTGILVIYDSGKVSLEHLLFSRHPSGLFLAPFFIANPAYQLGNHGPCTLRLSIGRAAPAGAFPTSLSIYLVSPIW